MLKLFPVLLLCFATLTLAAQGREKQCPPFDPDRDPKRWTWMDRNCTIHPRKDLEAILSHHRQWIQKYGITDQKQFFKFDYLSEESSRDSLRADLAGAHLEFADLTGALLWFADLSGADFDHADLTGARFEFADLTDAHLQFVDLTRANLRSADVSGANLRQAELTEAHLSESDPNQVEFLAADLSGAHLELADLTMAYLWEVDLTGAQLEGADLTSARLHGADLTDAYLRDADLAGADLSTADLTGARLEDADLTSADLESADLTGAQLDGTDLTETDFTQTELWHTFFEPKLLPPLNTIARAEGLRTLVWGSDNGNPYPVLDLRKALHDAGYSEAEAEVNLAFHRRTQSWWQVPLFDWTCAWGLDWARPIWIALALGLLFSLGYWSILRFNRSGRLKPAHSKASHKGRFRHPTPRRPSQLFVLARRHGRERQWPIGRDFAPLPWLYLPRPRRHLWLMRLPAQILRSVLARLQWELPLFWTASLFSVMSILNLGVQGLDLGRWLRLLQRREFDLKARGTIRLLAGFQSVASFLLLALTAYILLVHPLGE